MADAQIRRNADQTHMEQTPEASILSTVINAEPFARCDLERENYKTSRTHGYISRFEQTDRSAYITVYQIDFFTKMKFAGNPAGAVTNAYGLTDQQMQRIARELNNSVIAFLFKLEDVTCDMQLRFLLR